MEDVVAAKSATTTPGLDARVKAAKKAVVSTGMRVGRTGAALSAAGGVVAVVGWKMGHTAPALIAGGLLFVFGLLPFSIGWSLSKAGSPFLRALSEPNSVAALLMDAKQLGGGRRSLSVLLADGQRQTVALPDQAARELADVVAQLSPRSERGEREGAQRAIAQLMPA
jgi:hypothetical protein